MDHAIRARDVEFNDAWEKYRKHKYNDQATEHVNQNDQHCQTVGHKISRNSTSFMKKDKSKANVSNRKEWGQTRDSTVLATSKLYGSSARRSAQRVMTQNHDRGNIQQDAKSKKTTEKKNSSQSHALTLEGALTTSGSENLDEPHSQHAKRLVLMTQMQDRLRGQYLRFDIPNGLDDTVARFIAAVALRYNFVSPLQSLLHNSFSDRKQDNGCKQKSLAYAESLIKQLHGMGLIFIRQLLPIENAVTVFSSMDASDEFIALAFQLLVVLHQITGGNYMSRRYLTTQCGHFLTAQKELTRNSKPSTQHAEVGQVPSFLAEFCTSQINDLDAEDIPGGLWMNAAKEGANDPETAIKHLSEEAQIHQPKTRDRPSGIKTPKAWAVAYTRKVLSQNDAYYPAYNQYKNYNLLTPDNLNYGNE